LERPRGRPCPCEARSVRTARTGTRTAPAAGPQSGGRHDLERESGLDFRGPDHLVRPELVVDPERPDSTRT